jgi:hypothetical protein
LQEEGGRVAVQLPAEGSVRPARAREARSREEGEEEEEGEEGEEERQQQQQEEEGSGQVTDGAQLPATPIGPHVWRRGGGCVGRYRRAAVDCVASMGVTTARLV